MGKITLPWMDKIRGMEKDGFEPRHIVSVLKNYGKKEEARITKAFKDNL